MYHWFAEPGRQSCSRSPQLEIEPRLFESHLAWLTRKRFQSITLSDLHDHIDSGNPIPARSVVITFDDGCRDFIRHAWPTLKRFGLSATMFIVAGEVGGTNRWDRARGEPIRELLDWDEIRRMAREGLEVGSHTMTHPDLSSMGNDQASGELSESRKLLEQKLQRPVDFLAYPFGRFTSRTKRLAEEAGYRGACAVLLKPGDLFRSNRFNLRRLTVKGRDRGLRFATRFNVARLVHRISRGCRRRGPIVADAPVTTMRNDPT